METITIKRKEFEIISKMGEHSFKVTRHGKVYFLKKYEDKKSFEDFLDRQHILKNSAVEIPHPYLFDKSQFISVVDFIEGETMLDYLAKKSIDEEVIYELLFRTEFFARHDKMILDFKPENFKFTGKKLIYLPFTYKKFDPKYSFVTTDLRLWFMTKELASYIEGKGIEFDHTRIGNEYATNKEMALMAVKYYQ